MIVELQHPVTGQWVQAGAAEVVDDSAVGPLVLTITNPLASVALRAHRATLRVIWPKQAYLIGNDEEES